MMKRLLLTSLLAAFVASPALAAPAACYAPEQLQAEHLLRLHSELMVITVACHTGSQGENLVPAYTGFTRDNITVLHDAEQTMMSYYQKHYGGKGIEQLDQLRTRLGNEYGQKIADISAPRFCALYRDKVLAFARATPAQVLAEVHRITAVTPAYVSSCDQKTRVAEREKN